jgi:hypothetical protein
MQAKASVTMVELSPSRTAYSGHSGVGTVPNACNDTKAAVTSQKPMLCGTTWLRALIVDNLCGAAAIVEWSAIGGSSCPDGVPYWFIGVNHARQNADAGPAAARTDAFHLPGR